MNQNLSCIGEKTFVIALIIVLSPVVAWGMSKKIMNPDFHNKSNTLDVNSIELCDSVTCLNIDIYGKPHYWVKAQSNTFLKGKITGNEYHLLSTKGIEIDKETYLGDSAYLATTFVFEPLLSADTIVDFVEPDGSWNISDLNIFEEKQKRYKTQIHGSLEGHPESSWLLVQEACADPRVAKSKTIPVRNGKFNYDFETDDLLIYEIIIGSELLKGSFREARFCSSDPDIHVIIPDNDSRIKLKGGSVTEEYQLLQKKRFEYISEHLKNSDIRKKYLSMPDDIRLTPEALRIEKIRKGGSLPKTVQDSISDLIRNLIINDKYYSDIYKQTQKEYIDYSNKCEFDFYNLVPPSLPGLHMLYSKLVYEPERISDIYDIFLKNYKDTLTHLPYHRYITEAYEGGIPMPGRKYTNFSAPDINGKTIKISDIIDGKIAVINLWASWCGSCRRHSKAMIPLYDKYHDKGFEIVGIAKESINAEAMLNAIKKDGYTWTNLLELNDENKIWLKYGAGNSGGKIVVVDRDGTILAIDPSIDELSSILAAKL